MPITTKFIIKLLYIASYIIIISCLYAWILDTNLISLGPNMVLGFTKVMYDIIIILDNLCQLRQAVTDNTGQQLSHVPIVYL